MSRTFLSRARRLLADFSAAGSDAKALSLTTGGTRFQHAHLSGLHRSFGSISEDGDDLRIANPRVPPGALDALRARLLHLLNDLQEAGLHRLEVSARHHLVLSPTCLSLAARATGDWRTFATNHLIAAALEKRRLHRRDAMLLLPPIPSAHARLKTVAHADAWLAARRRRIATTVSCSLVFHPLVVVQSQDVVACGPLDDSHLWRTFHLR
jgi:hypothetical protein